MSTLHLSIFIINLTTQNIEKTLSLLDICKKLHPSQSLVTTKRPRVLCKCVRSILNGRSWSEQSFFSDVLVLIFGVDKIMYLQFYVLQFLNTYTNTQYLPRNDIWLQLLSFKLNYFIRFYLKKKSFSLFLAVSSWLQNWTFAISSK